MKNIVRFSLTKLAFGMAVLQGAQVVAKFEFLNAPVTTGGAMCDIVFFFAGCLAKEMDWLREIAEWPRARVWGNFGALVASLVAVLLAD